MVLEHIVAILIFGGPLLYIGLWMAIDPAGVASLPEFLLRTCGRLVQKTPGPASEKIVEHVGISRNFRRALRFVGISLIVFAIVA